MTLNRKGKLGVLIVAPFVFCRCAGPMTPLGGVWGIQVAEVTDGLGESTAEAATDSVTGGPQIRFDPPRQVLHASKPMTVVVDDPAGISRNYGLKVRYNGLDVTKSFLRQAQIHSIENHRLIIRIPKLKLSPTGDHRIEMTYTSHRGTPEATTVMARFEAPSCSIFDSHRVIKTEDFDPADGILHSIERISKQNGFSPAFSTALIAQESSFNPKTVSWAGAIGLTQVTPVAQAELEELVAQWPHYPGIARLPSPLVRFLVMSGDITERNEWRLQPERSIRGGLAYLKFIAEKWALPENVARIRLIAGTNPDRFEAMQTRLILASYNSGYARVQASLARNGRAWLKAPELKEAWKYVNRIFSFCDSFSQPEVDYENEA